MASPVALTGTPGTGKSAVARHLGPRMRSVEVGTLALRLGAGQRKARGVEVDLGRLQSALRRPHAWNGVDLVVGHLSHLLPLRDVIVLRCRPDELALRLAKRRRGTRLERQENVIAEATDVVLFEAVLRGGRVWEIDTTGRSIADVAREVAARVRHRGRSRYGRVDWLRDRRVTEHLLDRER